MTLIRVENGPVFPSSFLGSPRITFIGTVGGLQITSSTLIDLTGEKLAIVGEIMWDNGAATKTMSTSSKIHIRTGAITFADASTTMRVGLQGLLGAGSGAVRATPDGSWSVYTDLIGNGGLLTSSDDNIAKSIALTAGTKDVSQGELVAIVFDMTARAGSDSFGFSGLTGFGYTTTRPGNAQYIGSAWTYFGGTAHLANVLLESDDGTFGLLRGATYISGTGVNAFQASSTPDEYGLVFQVPFRCKIDSVTFSGGPNGSAAADCEVCIYSTPSSTPVELANYTLLGEHGSGYIDDRPTTIQLTEELELQPKTDYCVSIKATGTANFDVGYVKLANAAHRPVLGLANCRLGTRSNATGAFSETTTTIPLIAVGISALDDGNGAGRASLNIGV